MLEFLAKQAYVDFNVSDSVIETPISAAIKNGNLKMV